MLLKFFAVIDRVKFPKDFFRYCSVHQHGRRDVTWKSTVQAALLPGSLFSASHGSWKKATSFQGSFISPPQRERGKKEFLVSQETVVLRQWERSKQKFGFIKRVDKGWITTVKDLESWRFER